MYCDYLHATRSFLRPSKNKIYFTMKSYLLLLNIKKTIRIFNMYIYVKMQYFLALYLGRTTISYNCASNRKNAADIDHVRNE